MKSRKKKIWLSVLILILLTAVWYRDLLSYGWMQGMGQYKVLAEARPVEEFLSDESFPDSLKRKIRLIQTVRRYATDSLGLKNSENYTTLFDQKGQPILWNLSASERYKMEPKKWSFPFLGSFSYKGFFDLERAKAERDELKKEGFDTRVRTVGGWSTLGWFKDPILSNMLNRKDGQLAELIIHELTHATLYVKDSIEFNENLATFIGEKGAVKFLNEHYGPESQELKAYMRSFDDSKNFADHMLRGFHLLNGLYESPGFVSETDTVVKDKMKERLISEIVNTLDTIEFSAPTRFQQVFSKTLPNNAYFMAFQRYRAKQNVFDKDFKEIFHEDIREFIKYYSDKYPSL